MTRLPRRNAAVATCPLRRCGYIHRVTIETRRPPAGAAVLRQDITAAIQVALLEELASVGYGRLSIEAVARRAGVSKTAVYRRWESKLEMVVEVISRIAGNKLRLPDTGSLVGDLELLIDFAARALSHPLASHIIPDLLAEAARNPGIGQTLQEVLRSNQREVAKLIMDRAASREELSADADAESAIEMMLGSLYWRIVVAKGEPSPSYLKRLAIEVSNIMRSA